MSNILTGNFEVHVLFVICISFLSQMQFGTIILPAHRMWLLSSSPSIYTQELTATVFGSDTLANSSLRGSVTGNGKNVLCRNAITGIIGEGVCTKVVALLTNSADDETFQ